jgi:hypothetical protein
MGFQNPLFLLIGTLVVAYILLYFRNLRPIKETFQEPVGGQLEPQENTPCRGGSRVIMEQEIAAPYAKAVINGLDDYEVNLVFANEGEKALSQQQINRLTAQYPLDWSTLPPNSARFQKGVEALQEAYENPPPQPKGQDPYSEISGQSLTPPDTSAIEMEERKILQLYKPEKRENAPTTYDIDDAEAMIRKIYDAKGEVPDVLRKGEQVYEIVGVRKKDEKIVFEDEEAPTGKTAVASAGEATITVPPTAVDVSVGLDPFYEPGQQTRTGRWNYNMWTPGLERMFAPTYPQAKWY